MGEWKGYNIYWKQRKGKPKGHPNDVWLEWMGAYNRIHHLALKKIAWGLVWLLLLLKTTTNLHTSSWNVNNEGPFIGIAISIKNTLPWSSSMKSFWHVRLLAILRRAAVIADGGLPRRFLWCMTGVPSRAAAFARIIGKIRRRALMNQLLIWFKVKPVSCFSQSFSSSVG